MLLSYQKLDLPELAADTQRVIDFNDFSDIATTIDPDGNSGLPPTTL
jgi:regulator of sigma D